MYLIFDTETTGVPKRWDVPISDTDNWPRVVQIAWQLHDQMGRLIEQKDYLITPDNFDIPFDAERIHGISTELAMEQGVSIMKVFDEFNVALSKSKYIVGQNVNFDITIMRAEFYRYGIDSVLETMPVLDTCTEITAELCKIPGGKAGRFKLPKLTELHEFLFGVGFAEAHNATADVEATTRCFFELIRIGEGFSTKDIPTDYIENFRIHNPNTIQPIGLKNVNLKEESAKIRKRNTPNTVTQQSTEQITGNFVHLHNHTQFSILQSTTSIQSLIDAAIQNQMNAVAMTDINNMMGAFQFVSKIEAHNKKIKGLLDDATLESPVADTRLKPIIGCKLYICDNHLDKSRKDNGTLNLFIAKNKKGYHNIAKMSSIANTVGFYYVPRIDKKIVETYKEDVIVLSGNTYGDIPSKILNEGKNKAEEALLWWKEQFGDDFYLEIIRHGLEDENVVNNVLLEFAQKHNVKLVASNSTYYINKNEADTHDTMLCIKENENKNVPIGKGKGFRYGLQNDQYYFKSKQEMCELFADIPQAINNIDEIVAKIEPFSLKRDILLPKFDIPAEFITENDPDGKKGENKYLRHLTYLGAEKKYEAITSEVRERIDFELSIIEKTGYPGYFLIVQDFIAAARDMGVSVGPGRGSAAGSVVAYCLGITNMDPIKYDLLFERFLNPDRVSMPDIDIDFDDEGRAKVMQYVIDKYGQNQVAQIITYGTMAAKSSIRDAARVLNLPLYEADKIAKLIPNKSLQKIFSEPEEKLKKDLRPEEFDNVQNLKKLAQEEPYAPIIEQAKILEGSIRNTGIHACGVIITPDDISNFVPISQGKDELGLNVTQFDNSVAENAGLLKMDFLGLKTLTIIKDAIKLIKKTKNIELDPEKFPLDDKKTYELFQRGETKGVFQYESVGMQKYMRELKPTVFADLIAMNALYRPGPLEYIPSFIKRKHGIEPIIYDLDAMEEYLKETYGITVYQEQVMLLSQKLAGFTKGEADVLRKAMGKKQKDVLDKMKPKFIAQAEEKGHNSEKLEKIWKDWEAFASYAFNKSHSTCYAWIGYQTAYLKANYPAEFMAAVLSNNMNDIKQVTFFLEECKQLKISVLGPDVNESYYKFTVNENGDIRFGMGAIKNVGSGAVQTIIDNRKNKKYKSISDLAQRIDLRAANKKAFENLAYAGGFDCFPNIHRAQYFAEDATKTTFIEKVLKFGAKIQSSNNSSQINLFGETEEILIPEPQAPEAEQWSTMQKLAKEKEVVGIFISGHPLDDYKYQLKYFSNVTTAELKYLKQLAIGKNYSIGGIITSVQHLTSKDNKGYAIFTIETIDGSTHEFRIFEGKEAIYSKFKAFLTINNAIQIDFKIEKPNWMPKDGKEIEPRIVFTKIQFLSDALKSTAKNIYLELDVNEVNNNMINNMLEVFRQNKGDTPLHIDLIEQVLNNKNIESEQKEDKEDTEITDSELSIADDEVDVYKKNVLMTLESGNIRVNITLDFLQNLEENLINFRLN
ncbi:MAG: DNA polymerase III subunit alpha [Bacteroidota bacterium]|nr:DNA polymerase III subunit alpha [Bacteroidota bacterium]